MNTDMTTKNRLDELMPWYVNGRISAEDRAWVEAQLAASEDARAELAWHQSLAESFADQVDELPLTPGLDALQQHLRAERVAQAKPSWLMRLLNSLPVMSASPVMALVALLVIGQAGVIALLLSKDPASTELGAMRSLNRPADQAVAALQITFANTAVEPDMRRLLLRIGGRVIDGPDQFGAYIVTVAPNQLELARHELEEDALVASVTFIEHFQPRR